MSLWSHSPFLVVISAPSGTGKTTICKLVLESDRNLVYSISATTRKKRKGEKDGIDYFFIERETFKGWLKGDKLLEWSEIYGEYYGTPIEPIKKFLKEGKDVLLDLDYKGKISLLEKFPGKVVSIFLIPTGIEELRERLINRGAESGDKLEIRLEKMREELGWAVDYDYWVLNDDKEKAKNRVITIIKAERMKRKRLSLDILKSLKAKIPYSKRELS